MSEQEKQPDLHNYTPLMVLDAVSCHICKLLHVDDENTPAWPKDRFHNLHFKSPPSISLYPLLYFHLMPPPPLTINSTIKLPSGNQIPRLGYGVYQARGRECTDGVTEALRAGYRHGKYLFHPFASVPTFIFTHVSGQCPGLSKRRSYVPHELYTLPTPIRI